MNQRQYSAAVHDILQHLENIFKNQANAPQVGPYSLESLIASADVVIFKQGSDWRGPQQTQFLTPLEELELIDELCIYLQDQKHEYVRYRVFEALFSTARTNALEYRREILCRLVSLGVVSKSVAVLECAALWMKSCKKDHSVYLVMSIVTDYCTLQMNGAAALKQCGEISPRFCCVFMIALTSKYKMLLKESQSESWPCAQLLDVVQHWLMSDSTMCFCTATQAEELGEESGFSVIVFWMMSLFSSLLCLAAALVEIHHASKGFAANMDKLWRTVIKATQSLPDSLSLTPLDGLAQWCVKSPFAPMLYQKSTTKRSDDPNLEITYAELHSRLHYAFLKSLLASKPALKAIAKGSVLGNPDLQLWNKNHIHSLVGDMMTLCSQSDATPQSGSPDETAVDRFSQISQTAITMRILNCSKNQFQGLSDPLPKTKLLELIAYGLKRTRPADDTPMDTDY